MTAKPAPTPEAAPSNPPPTLAWKIWSAVFVIAYMIAIWWFIEWRSAPPPVPPLADPFLEEVR